MTLTRNVNTVPKNPVIFPDYDVLNIRISLYFNSRNKYKIINLIWCFFFKFCSVFTADLKQENKKTI